MSVKNGTGLRPVILLAIGGLIFVCSTVLSEMKTRNELRTFEFEIQSQTSNWNRSAADLNLKLEQVEDSQRNLLNTTLGLSALLTDLRNRDTEISNSQARLVSGIQQAGMQTYATNVVPTDPAPGDVATAEDLDIPEQESKFAADVKYADYLAASLQVPKELTDEDPSTALDDASFKPNWPYFRAKKDQEAQRKWVLLLKMRAGQNDHR